MHSDIYGASDIGRTRKVNQDQFLISKLSKQLNVAQTSLAEDTAIKITSSIDGELLLVADGVGGNPAGEEASAMVLDVISNYVLHTMPWFFRLSEDHDEDLQDELLQALGQCELSLQKESDAHPEHKNLATTLTLAYLLWPRLYLVHVGDSRAYLIRNSHIQQLTTDHTVAQQMVDKGILSEEQAENSPFGNTVWNVLGGEKSGVSPQVSKTHLLKGDTLLLCTDGLTSHVSDSELLELSSMGTSEKICKSLIDAANRAGGKDNITAIVARY